MSNQDPLLAALVALSESLRGTRRYFGEPGSMDVDVVAWNAKVDKALIAIINFRRELDARALSAPAASAPQPRGYIISGAQAAPVAEARAGVLAWLKTHGSVQCASAWRGDIQVVPLEEVLMAFAAPAAAGSAEPASGAHGLASGIDLPPSRAPATQEAGPVANAVLAFAEFLHSMPDEAGYAAGPARIKFDGNGGVADGPWWATQEDTERWARAFLAARKP